MTGVTLTAIALLFLIFNPVKIIALICIGALILAFPVSSTGTVLVLGLIFYLIKR